MEPIIPPQTPIPPTPSQPFPIQPVTPMPVKSNNPLLMVCIIIILLLVLGAAGFFAYQNMQLKQQISLVQPTPTPVVPSPISSPVIAPCSTELQDTFPGITLNSQNWNIVASPTSLDSRDNFNVSNSQLIEKVGLQKSWRGRAVEMTNLNTENISIEIDVLPVETDSSSDQMIGTIVLRDKDLKNGVVLLRDNLGGVRAYNISNGKSNDTGISNIKTPTNVPLRFKILKIGTDVKLSYKLHNEVDYHLVSEFTNIQSALSNLRLTATGSGSGIGVASFSNFDMCQNPKVGFTNY
ncbi:MAG TPA: hypothetical protein VMR81_03480 [Patescibacteria group bacterium]|nr:hypothetical protein [Patescibacteria group bacterium]